MTAPTPSYQHIWECDAESFSVGEEPIRDDVEEEALDAEKEKKEDDEEGTVKEDNKEDTRMRRQPWTGSCATLPNPSYTRRPMTLRIEWTFNELSSKQSKLQEASIPIYQVFILFHISGLMTTPRRRL